MRSRLLQHALDRRDSRLRAAVQARAVQHVAAFADRQQQLRHARRAQLTHRPLRAGDAPGRLARERGVAFDPARERVGVDRRHTRVRRDARRDAREHVRARGIEAIDIARELDRLEQRPLQPRVDAAQRAQRAIRGPGIETHAAAPQHLLAICVRETLAGHLLDALIVAPCVLAPFRRQLARAFVGEEPRRHQLEHARMRGVEPGQRGRARVAPAAQRIEEILKPERVHRGHAFTQERKMKVKRVYSISNRSNTMHRSTICCMD
ncbi:hypothetical protein BURPS1710b_A2459 [Burkholderia pseudomallei 1710b]|uniref:Uncharacterized protein n=1 Tax=Burkholderia pseudomallei (strain 1710b) TaxID=320372 RepID=Q3JFP4_BURP1|nr:hypothetical protein BURPS1710b_A2459 [Burkholderia pseudomallei 1710b]